MDIQNNDDRRKARDAVELARWFAKIDDPVLRREIIDQVKATIESKATSAR